MRSIAAAFVVFVLTSLALAQSDKPDRPLSMRIGECKMPDAPLSDVIASLREKGAQNLLVNWRALDGAGIGSDKRVKIDLPDATLEQVLGAVRDSLGDKKDALMFVERGDVVFLSTPDDAKTAADTLDGLNKPIPALNFNSIPAGDALDFLRNITNLPIEVRWDMLAKEGIGKDRQITLEINKQKLHDVMGMLTSQLDAGAGKLDYTVEGSAIVISTRDDLMRK